MKHHSQCVGRQASYQILRLPGHSIWWGLPYTFVAGADVVVLSRVSSWRLRKVAFVTQGIAVSDHSQRGLASWSDLSSTGNDPWTVCDESLLHLEQQFCVPGAVFARLQGDVCRLWNLTSNACSNSEQHQTLPNMVPATQQLIYESSFLWYGSIMTSLLHCQEKWNVNPAKCCRCHKKWHVNSTKSCACHEEWHVNFAKCCACH